LVSKRGKPLAPDARIDMFRFYGPEKAVFEKTWKLRDVEQIAIGQVGIAAILRCHRSAKSYRVEDVFRKRGLAVVEYYWVRTPMWRAGIVAKL
jgi:hypothetical protein